MVHVGDLRGSGAGSSVWSRPNIGGTPGRAGRAEGERRGVVLRRGAAPGGGDRAARLAPGTAPARAPPRVWRVRGRTGAGSSPRFGSKTPPPAVTGASPYLDPALATSTGGRSPRRAPSGRRSCFSARAARRGGEVRARVDRDAAKTPKGTRSEKVTGRVGTGRRAGRERRRVVERAGRRAGDKEPSVKLPPTRAKATRGRSAALAHFHPVFPFAMSVSRAFMQPQVVSFHFREERTRCRVGHPRERRRRGRHGDATNAPSASDVLTRE